MRSIGRAELVQDARFTANADRVKNVAALDEAVGGWIGARTLEENLAQFEKEGVTVGPVCDIADLIDHMYVKSRAIQGEKDRMRGGWGRRVVERVGAGGC